jgi:hypothetical protein
MAERNSEYIRIVNDDYATPAWVTRALLSVEDFPQPIWECAPGAGYMADALMEMGNEVLLQGVNFLDEIETLAASIVTNPPYRIADAFIRHALELTHPFGKVAMLLPLAFDTAKSRREIFRDCAAFKAKYQLVRRISWANLDHIASPSQNHAWYVWDHCFTGKPIIGYLEGND